MTDEFHGQGGTYEVKDGKRVLVEGSRTKPLTEGGGAREANKKPLDNRSATGPALPAPAPDPWAEPAKIPDAGPPEPSAEAGAAPSAQPAESRRDRK